MEHFDEQWYRFLPALAGDLVLVGSEDFFFYAMDAGTEQSGGSMRRDWASHPHRPSSGDLTVFGSKDGFLYALQTQTGELRWKTAVGEVVTAPAVIANGVVCIQAGGTFALDSTTGNVAGEPAWAGHSSPCPCSPATLCIWRAFSGEVYALR